MRLLAWVLKQKSFPASVYFHSCQEIQHSSPLPVSYRTVLTACQVSYSFVHTFKLYRSVTQSVHFKFSLPSRTIFVVGFVGQYH
jgi:hypothetical protein